MEKEEAIEFILRELKNNRSQDEIVTTLSRELGAPQSIVKKFVSRVMSDNIPAPGKSVPPISLASLNSSPQDVQPLEQPLGLQSDSPFIVQSPAERSGSTENRSFSFEPPAQSPISSSFDQAVLPQSQPPQPDEQLEKIILKGLSKHRRMDDIVMEVCHHRDLDWKQAQRLVAQVQAKNRKRLTSRRNAFLIPLAFVMIVAGLALLLASGSEIQSTANALLNRDFSNPTLSYMEETVRLAPAYFITGLILVLGGGVGLFTALKSQLE